MSIDALRPSGVLRPPSLSTPTARLTVPARVPARPGRYWQLLAIVWAVYYVAVLTVGRYEAYTRVVSWAGGGLATILTLLPMVRHGRRFPTETWLLFAFLLWSLAGFHRVEDLPSFVRHAQMIMQMVVIVTCVGLVLRESGGSNWMYIAFLLVAVFNVIFGLEGISMEYVEADSQEAMRRNAGLTGNANALGYYSFMGLLGGMAVFGEKRSWLLRTGVGLASVLALYGLLTSASRGAFLALMVALLLWATLCSRTQLRNRLLLISSLAVVGAVAYLLGRFVIESTHLGTRFSQGVSLEDGSSEMRLVLVLKALELAAEHPLQGVGVGQYASASGFGRYAHNEMAELLSTTGLIGAALYFGLYVIAWRRVGRALRQTSDPLVQYRGNFARVVIVVLLLSGAVFRPNYLSLDGMYLIALAVGLSEWTAAEAGRRMQAARAQRALRSREHSVPALGARLR